MIGKLLESNSSETHQIESSNAAVFLRNHQQHNRRHSTLPINVKAMYTKIGRQRSSFDKPSIQTGEDASETNPTPISGISSDWNFEIHSIPSNPLYTVVRNITYTTKFEAAKTSTILNNIYEIESRYDLKTTPTTTYTTLRKSRTALG